MKINVHNDAQWASVQMTKVLPALLKDGTFGGDLTDFLDLYIESQNQQSIYYNKAKQLDQYNGIDYILFNKNNKAELDRWATTNSNSVIPNPKNTLLLSSRVQPSNLYNPYTTFTIRKSRPSSANTELQKLKDNTFDNAWHIHTYVCYSPERKPAALVGVIKSAELIYHLRNHYDEWSLREPVSDEETEFLYIEWETIKKTCPSFKSNFFEF